MKAAAILVLALAPALSACGGLEAANPLPPEARGPCTMVPVGEAGPLEAPYAVTMNVFPGGTAEASVDWKASGWSGTVEMGVVAPRGRLEAFGQDAQSFNQGRMGQGFNEPGTWVIEFEDRNCFQRIVIEVGPPDG